MSQLLTAPDQPPAAAADPGPPDAAPRHERWIILAGLALLSALSWAYLFWDASRMAAGLSCCVVEPGMSAWTPADLGMLFLMWTIMMAGMMVPSAAPMVLVFASVNRQRRASRRPYTPTALFLLGYLMIWTLFSAAATLLQWALHGAALLSPQMVSTSPLLGAAILIPVGLFQFTPWKDRCLLHCRTPLQFILTSWQDGRAGAIRMGLSHGAYCTGCCWLLMCVLFVTGVMNLLWVAVISAFVLLEKVTPGVKWVRWISGVALLTWGLWLSIAKAG